MSGISDRLSGAFFLLLGVVMYLYVNPTYIESVDGGNLAPRTFPNVLSIVIAISGAFLMFKPTEHQAPDIRSLLTTSAYVVVLVIGLYAMSVFGFVFVAPLLALTIMLGIGERRLFWLVPGVVAMPALIWFLVSHVLGRALP